MQQLSMPLSSPNGEQIGECINCHDTFVKLEHNLCKYCHRAYIERCNNITSNRQQRVTQINH